MKLYRGGCTERNWNNISACPTWCNDSKHHALSAIFTCRLSRRISRKNKKADHTYNAVRPNNTGNIFHCPGTGWMYCNQSLSSQCQSGPAGFEDYSSARFLGTPPIPSSESVATPRPYISTSSTTVTESTTLTHPPTCTQIIHQSSKPATAIGVGLGVPFGIAAIGFLVSLFWRDARRKGPIRTRQDIWEDKRTRGHNNPTDGRIDGNDNTLPDGEMDGNGLRLELQGSMITAELHGVPI